MGTEALAQAAAAARQSARPTNRFRHTLTAVPRKQLPVYSPVTVGSVAAAFAASVTGGARARTRVLELVRAEFGPRELLLVDSGTSALTLALRAVRQEREEVRSVPLVALPAYGCFDLATAAVGADVRVVLYDLDPSTLGPNWPSLERALAHKPAAVVVAHLYGVPVDVTRAARLAAAVDAVLIDDAAQGVGASIAGRPLGSFGALGVLSFGRGKGRTGGGGGALLANDDRGVALLAHVRGGVAAPERGLRAAVMLKAQWLLGRPSLYWLPASLPFLALGETPYRAPHRASSMADACVGALAAVWDESVREIVHRREAAAAWRRSTAVQGWAIPEGEAGAAVRGELRLPAVLPPDQRSTQVVTRMEGGVMPGYPMPLSRLAALADRLERIEPAPGADILAQRLVTLPCHRHAIR
jgi:perosamine synthetase